jgi:hypothetical protein
VLGEPHLPERRAEYYRFYHEALTEATRRSHLVESELSETILPLYGLRVFNLLNTGVRDHSRLIAEFAKFKKLDQLELAYSSLGNPAPTVGTEIEIPTDSVTDEAKRVLAYLKIPNESENKDLWEIHPNFTYTGLAQARYLLELVNLGAIPMETDSKGKPIIDDRVPLSLHVNYGIPPVLTESIIKSESSLKSVACLVDLLTYAFSSRQRLINRKTKFAVWWETDAKESKKTGTLPAQPSEPLRRLEYRTSDFKDFSTFRFLMQSQALVASYFSSLKLRSGIETLPVEKKLATIWDSVEPLVQLTLDTYGLRHQDYNLNNRGQGVELLATSTLRQESRSIVDSYSRKAILLLQQAH